MVSDFQRRWILWFLFAFAFLMLLTLGAKADVFVEKGTSQKITNDTFVTVKWRYTNLNDSAEMSGDKFYARRAGKYQFNSGVYAVGGSAGFYSYINVKTGSYERVVSGGWEVPSSAVGEEINLCSPVLNMSSGDTAWVTVYFDSATNTIGAYEQLCFFSGRYVPVVTNTYTNSSGTSTGGYFMGEHLVSTNALGYLVYSNAVDALNANLSVARDLRVFFCWTMGMFLCFVVIMVWPGRKASI